MSHTLQRLNLRDIEDVRPHRLEWKALNAAEKELRDAAKTFRKAVPRATNGSDTTALEDMNQLIETLLDGIAREKDFRTETGDRSARDRATFDEEKKMEPNETPDTVTAAQRAKRPEYEPGVVHTGDATEASEGTAIALRSGQSFRAWAQARSPLSENLRGMDAGKFLRAMVVDNKSDVERRALSEASDSAGGYTVPNVLSAELIDKARAASVVMQAGAQTVPLTSDNNTIAKVLTDPTPAWRDEAGAVANSDGTFGAVVLTPRSLAVAVDISAELMADSLNLATALPNILAAAMATELDRVALIGSGSAPEPRGIANTVGIGTHAQDAEISDYTNLSKARTGILTANRGPVSAFVMAPRDEGAFTDLVDSQGQPLMAPRAVGEIPVFTTTSLPVDGGTGSDESTIIAGNFAHLLVGIRSGVQVELFKGPKYISNLQMTMVAHLRADIAVQDPGAFFTLTGVGKVA